MFKIRPEHIRNFQPNAEAAFARAVMEYIRKTHSEAIVKLPSGDRAVGELSANVLRKMIEGGIAQARGHRINLKSEMIAFVTTMFLAAPNFDEHPAAKRVLAEVAELASQSFEALLDEMTDEHWEEVEKNYEPEAWKTPVEMPMKAAEQQQQIEELKPAEMLSPLAAEKPIEKVTPVTEAKPTARITPPKKIVKKAPKKKVIRKQVNAASRTQPPVPVAPKEPCANKNWTELIYKYPNNTPVGGAKFKVFDAATNQSLACGTLDSMGFARVENLPDSTTKIKFSFSSDPRPFEIYPGYRPGRHNLTPETTEIVEEDGTIVSVAKWLGGALAGDFAEDQSLGQIAFGTVVTLIPVVDQVGDVRDLVANSYQLTVKKRYNEFGPWFGMVTTLFGCIPAIGTVAKGVIKAVVSKLGKRLPLAQLIKYMNSVGIGNVVEFLREFVKKIDTHASDFAEKIIKMLDEMKGKLEKARFVAFGKAEEAIDKMLEGIAELYARVPIPQKVREIVAHIAGKIKETLSEATDYVMDGVTRAQNGARQLKEKFIKRTAEGFSEMALRAGMKEEQINRLIKHCADKDQIVIVRATNPKSLRFQGGKFDFQGKKVECFPKPVTIKLNTAKGDFPERVQGLVVRPKSPDADQLKEIEELKKNDFFFDDDGVLHDPQGNVFHGDYDVQSVHRYVDEIDDADNAKRVLTTEMSNPEKGLSTVDDLNEAIHGGVIPKERRNIQHGGEADFRKRKNSADKSILTSEQLSNEGKNGGVMRAGKDYKLGRQYGKDEKYIVITPDGAKILESPEELKSFYKNHDLPWEYDNVKPIDPALANAANGTRRAAEQMNEED